MNQQHKHIVDRICTVLGISLADLARDLKITRSAINEWKRKNSDIPVEHCKYLENRLRGISHPLTCIDMRPRDWHRYWPELAKDKEVAQVEQSKSEWVA